MNRRTYLGSLAGLSAVGTAGCFTRIGGSDDVSGPTIDASEFLLAPGDVNTDWVYAPSEDEPGYDFGFVNPNAILAMERRFRNVGATIQLAGSRHFLFWQSIDPELIDQLTFIDRREAGGLFEAGAIVAEGEIDRDAVLEEAPDFLSKHEILEEREVGDADLLVFDSDDVVGVGEDFVILSLDPFRRDRNQLSLVERVLESKHEGRETYFETDDTFPEIFAEFDEAHIFEAGAGERLDDGPEDAIAFGEALAIEGAFAVLTLVAIFENDADARHAAQFDPSFDELSEHALVTDTQVRGRMIVTTQRVDTDAMNAERNQNPDLMGDL